MSRGNRNRGQANKNEKINKTTTNSNQIRETKNDQKSIVEKSNAKKMTSDSPPRAEKKPHWTELECLDFSDVGGDDSLEQDNPPLDEKKPHWTELDNLDLGDIEGDISIEKAELRKKFETAGEEDIEIDLIDRDIRSKADELFKIYKEHSRKRTSRDSETEKSDCDKKLKMNINKSEEDKQDVCEESTEIIHVSENGSNDDGQEGPEIPQNIPIRCDEYIPARPDLGYRKFEVFVKGCEIDITAVNARRVQTDVRVIIDRVPNIVKVYKSLRIDCDSENEKRTLMNTHYLAGHRVEYTEPYWKTRNNAPRKSKHRGIIFGVDEEISNEEMSMEIGATAERIIKKFGGRTKITKQMVIYFENELPQYVSYGYRRYRVSEFLPDPTRCFQCQKYGHKAKECHSRTTCPICAEKHTYEECKIKDSYRQENNARCPNCKGPHPASYKGCPKYEQAKAVIKIRVKENVTYAEAVRLRAARLKNDDTRKKERNSGESTSDKDITRTRAYTIDNENGLIGESHEAVNTNGADKNSRPRNNVSNTNITSPDHSISEKNGSDANRHRENIHDNCVSYDRIINLIQTIGLLMGKSLPKNELIENLYSIFNEFVRTIKPPIPPEPKLN